MTYDPPADKRAGHGCLPPFVALLTLVVIVAVGYVWGVAFVKDHFNHHGPADYTGPGTGRVRIQVTPGQTSSDIAITLHDKNVVASAQSFVAAASADRRSIGIQPGFYDMRQKMSSKAALAILVDPRNRVEDTVVIPEGLRAGEIVARIASQTNLTKRALDAALAHPASIGIPPEANGKVEGYLYPLTYQVTPDMTARTLLRQMVTEYRREAVKLHLSSGAQAMGHTPYEVLTVASIVQAEARRSRDMPKVARVIYNRLDRYDMPLQVDSTLHYYYRSRGNVQLTPAQLAANEPYNTRILRGLPPTPIDSPGETALKAALHPAPGTWRYFVTVNLRTGETKFATTTAQFAAISSEFQRYCQTSSAC
jgi:UPF0755 protein